MVWVSILALGIAVQTRGRRAAAAHCRDTQTARDVMVIHMGAHPALRAQPARFRRRRQTYRLGSGVLITTMLPLANTSAAPGLERFDPRRVGYRRRAE
jgi:hypothetical protein